MLSLSTERVWSGQDCGSVFDGRRARSCGASKRCPVPCTSATTAGHRPPAPGKHGGATVWQTPAVDPKPGLHCLHRQRVAGVPGPNQLTSDQLQPEDAAVLRLRTGPLRLRVQHTVAGAPEGRAARRWHRVRDQQLLQPGRLHRDRRPQRPDRQAAGLARLVLRRLRDDRRQPRLRRRQRGAAAGVGRDQRQAPLELRGESGCQQPGARVSQSTVRRSSPSTWPATRSTAPRAGTTCGFSGSTAPSPRQRGHVLRRDRT